MYPGVEARPLEARGYVVRDEGQGPFSVLALDGGEGAHVTVSASATGWRVALLAVNREDLVAIIEAAQGLLVEMKEE